MRAWLQQYRQAKNLTQSQVAVSCGISESYYCQIEKGERGVRVNIAKRIAKTLGFEWTIFFDDYEVRHDKP